MAGIRFPDLVDSFVDTIERSGATVIRSRARDNERPAMIRVNTGTKPPIDCLLFLWKITPGGGPPGTRPENKRRVQLTSMNVDGMPLRPGVRTLLGGWSEEFGVYAFWDARRHTRFSQRSPSLQADARTLETASRVGLASQTKPTQQGEEVVVACAPHSLLWYIENGTPLHNAEADANSVADLAEATPEEEREFLDSAQTENETMRRFDLVQTMRLFRSAQFRPLVLHAFSHRCAVCNYDLKLVDAAHIVPVVDHRSTDEVTNGLALCRLHHAAFDNALLGVQSDYRIIVNPNAADRLRELNLATAIDDFTARLPERIRTPTSIEARPNPEYLRLGLGIRGWPSGLIA